MNLAGVFAALTTPYAQDGSVSLADLKHNVLRYNSTDLAGYAVVGSTGESVLLTRAEMDSILATAKECAAKEKTLIAGTGAESTAETIERTKRAAVTTCFHVMSGPGSRSQTIRFGRSTSFVVAFHVCTSTIPIWTRATTASMESATRYSPIFVFS